MITCRIFCSTLAQHNLSVDFSKAGNKQISGIGCAMKCLLTHEMSHCQGIYAGNWNATLKLDTHLYWSFSLSHRSNSSGLR